MALPGTYQKKYVRVNATADGSNTVITGTAGKKIVVLGYAFNVNAAGVITVQDSGTPTVLASFEFTDGGGASYAGSEGAPAFEVGVGLNLVISNAAGVDSLGHITYILT